MDQNTLIAQEAKTTSQSVDWPAYLVAIAIVSIPLIAVPIALFVLVSFEASVIYCLSVGLMLLASSR
jgi:hypothetical protein